MNKKAAAVGTFDGVHLGHKAVIRTLIKEAEILGVQPIAVTFDRHPLSLIAPTRKPKQILSLQRRIELLENEGVVPKIFRFDQELRKTTAQAWMKSLHDTFGVRLLVVGYDNTFGCDGVTMSVSDYVKIGETIGMRVVEAPIVEGISSSAIRKAIKEGEIKKANEMLGRPFEMTGKVVDGNKLGRELGYPTANLEVPEDMAVPSKGVYATICNLPDGTERPTMVNIGFRPTVMRGEKLTIEAHIIGWEGDLYGKNLTLSFFERLRDEEKFKSITALKDRLDTDLKKTLQILSSESFPTTGD